VDARVLGFTVLVCVATGLGFGLVPALTASRANPGDALAAERGAVGAGRGRLRSALVAAEVAAAMLLLVGAGLMLRSFWRLSAVAPGFAPSDVTVAQMALPDTRYDGDAKLDAFYRGLRERLGALPGVQAAGLAISAPFTQSHLSMTFDVVGVPPLPPGQ